MKQAVTGSTPASQAYDIRITNNWIMIELKEKLSYNTSYT